MQGSVMDWGRKIISHVFPIVRLAIIFFVALFLPRFFLRTLNNGKAKVQNTALPLVVSHRVDDIAGNDTL